MTYYYKLQKYNGGIWTDTGHDKLTISQGQSLKSKYDLSRLVYVGFETDD